MSKTLILAVALSAASPELAYGDPVPPRGADGIEHEARRAAERMNDPAVQGAIGDAMATMVGAMLDLRIDALKRAIDRVDPKGADRNAGGPKTLRDVIARDDPNFDARVADDARVAARGMGAMAGAAVDMAPEMRRVAERVRAQVEEALRKAGSVTR